MLAIRLIFELLHLFFLFPALFLDQKQAATPLRVIIHNIIVDVIYIIDINTSM